MQTHTLSMGKGTLKVGVRVCLGFGVRNPQQVEARVMYIVEVEYK